LRQEQLLFRQVETVPEKSEPVLQRDGGSIYYINLSQDEYKPGSFAQTLNTSGTQQLKMPPSLKSVQYHSGINLGRQYSCWT
jgi:hypothetical protein